jgi:hypothetical protein
MDAKDLLWFSSGFRTVEAWRDAMCAHGYRVPVHLCHGLHEAMQYLDLTFPAAFQLLWVNSKIFVNGRVLVYDFSIPDLWAAGKRPASTPPAGSIPSAVAWDRDVLALIPATEEVLRLDSAWCLTADSSPLMKLTLWRPGEDDEDWRQFLLEFGDEWRRDQYRLVLRGSSLTCRGRSGRIGAMSAAPVRARSLSGLQLAAARPTACAMPFSVVTGSRPDSRVRIES